MFHSKNDYQICGILDFGDIQYSAYIFELAIAMTYAMVLTGDLRAGGLVLAGYQATRRVLKDEYRLLKVRNFMLGKMHKNTTQTQN